MNNKEIIQPISLTFSTASTGEIVEEYSDDMWFKVKEFKYQVEDATEYQPDLTEFEPRPEPENFAALIEDEVTVPESTQTYISYETQTSHEAEKLPKNYNVEKNFARIFRDDFNKLDGWVEYFCQNSEHVHDINSEYFNNYVTLFWHVKYYVNNLDWASISKMKKRGEFKKTFDFSEDQSPVKQIMYLLVEAYFYSDLPMIAIQGSNKMKQKTKDDLLLNMSKYADLLLGKTHKKSTL